VLAGLVAVERELPDRVDRARHEVVFRPTSKPILRCHVLDGVEHQPELDGLRGPAVRVATDEALEVVLRFGGGGLDAAAM
jgi:hypothetical protein